MDNFTPRFPAVRPPLSCSTPFPARAAFNRRAGQRPGVRPGSEKALGGLHLLLGRPFPWGGKRSPRPARIQLHPPGCLLGPGWGWGGRGLRPGRNPGSGGAHASLCGGGSQPSSVGLADTGPPGRVGCEAAGSQGAAEGSPLTPHLPPQHPCFRRARIPRFSAARPPGPGGHLPGRWRLGAQPRGVRPPVGEGRSLGGAPPWVPEPSVRRARFRPEASGRVLGRGPPRREEDLLRPPSPRRVAL